MEQEVVVVGSTMETSRQLHAGVGSRESRPTTPKEKEKARQTAKDQKQKQKSSLVVTTVSSVRVWPWLWAVRVLGSWAPHAWLPDPALSSQKPLRPQTQTQCSPARGQLHPALSSDGA